jgi:hypothetical protein
VINRRSLLGLAVAAPAIVRAESLMKIWVPKNSGFITYRVDEERMTPLDDGGLMSEHWVVDTSGQIAHRAMVRKGGVFELYVNGVRTG